MGGGPGASGSLSFKLTRGTPPPVGTGKGKRKKTEEPNVICREGTYVSRDGTRQPAPDISKDNPLELSYRNGRLQGEHVFTQFLNGNRHRLQWTTTVSASMKNGELSGTYKQFSTLTDFSDKSYEDGFMCNKRWLIGKITGRPDKNGRVQVRVGDWEQKSMVREYGVEVQLDRSVKLRELNPWHEDITPAPEFHLEFELQLPVGP